MALRYATRAALPKVGTNGELTISTADGIDFEGCNYIDVDIKVEEAENENICRVRVNIVDQNDDPTIPAGQVREVEETAERNEQFGEPLLASDPDRDQSLLFEIIGGNIGDAFQISRCSGQVRVGSGWRGWRGWRARWANVAQLTPVGHRR